MNSMPFYLSYTALWVLVILHSLVLLGLVHTVYQLQQSGATTSSRSLQLGKEAPVFNATALSGSPISNADFTNIPMGLIFISPDCPACKEILGGIEHLNKRLREKVIVICLAKREECLRLSEQYRFLDRIVEDEKAHIGQLYNVSVVPTVAVISANNIVQAYGHLPLGELKETLERAMEVEA